MKNKIQKLLKSGIEIIKNNKIIVVIILIFILSIYFWGIRPYQIRKECSTVKYTDWWKLPNSEYNEVVEMQKQRMLANYIQCRNNNLAEGDQIYINKNGNNPNPFTQEQYNTLTISELSKIVNDKLYPDIFIKSSLGNYNPKQDANLFGLTIRNLEQLNQLALGKLSPLLYHTYNGYIIDYPTYDELKENKDKYPKCNFPDDFVKKELSGGSDRSRDATDTEYKTCLRKNGLEDDKKPTSQEVRKDKALCYQWYGKEACDDPNFNPE